MATSGPGRRLRSRRSHELPGGRKGAPCGRTCGRAGRWGLAVRSQSYPYVRPHAPRASLRLPNRALDPLAPLVAARRSWCERVPCGARCAHRRSCMWCRWCVCRWCEYCRPGAGCGMSGAGRGSGPGTVSYLEYLDALGAVRCGAVRCVSCLSAPRRGPWSLGVAASERRARVPVRTAWRRGRPAGRSVPGCGAAVRPRRSARP